ncbi:MAG: hypothetical protein SCK29_12010 [Bacillota bacterium]|nr:hypothetical protein [Bacillota bacterium]MDW7684829.1 hypothetical protein [Bacillota bacterium]
MLGGDEINKHYLLRYGLTKDFFETFSSLKCKNIELPLLLIRNFHNYIRPVVDRNLTNNSLAEELQSRHGFTSAKDIQNALARVPMKQEDFSLVPSENSILTIMKYYPFVRKHFPHNHVTVITTRNLNGRFKVKNPSNFSIFNYPKKMRETVVPQETLQLLAKQADFILSQQREHVVFGRPGFRKWFQSRLISAVKIVTVLDELIVKNRPRVIIDHTELTNPGTALSLLAVKYNVPFVNVPYYLLSDKSVLPTRAAYHCVWGKIHKNWLVQRGVPADKIIPVGSLRLTGITKGRFISRSELCRRLKIPEESLIITFLMQPFPGTVNKKLLLWIQRAARDLRIVVIVKYHPLDKARYVVPSHAKMTPVPRNMPLYDVLNSTDLVMTVSSTAAIEAALFGKGIIVLQPEMPYHYHFGYNNFSSFLKKATAGPAVHSAAELRGLFRRVSAKKNLCRALNRKTQAFLSNALEERNASPGHSLAEFIRKIIM